MHIALVGGMATGKTTLAKILHEEFPEFHYMYMSRFAISIPMGLESSSHPHLLELDRESYIDAVVNNQDVPSVELPRPQLNAFGERVLEHHGNSIFAETAFAALPPGKQGIFDNVAFPEAVTFLKEQGAYVIGLDCALETQVERRLADPRAIDSPDRATLEHYIHETQEFTQSNACLKLADMVYNTDEYSSAEIVHELACIIED